MNTCLAKLFFHQLFPASWLDLVAESFDLVAPVHDFQPRQVPGVIAEANWKLTIGINIITGHSGSGKTRVLKAMKKPLDGLDTDCVKRAAPDNLSQGQQIFLALETLLQVQPPNSCLMVDDVMGMLDEKHLQLVWSRLKQHHQQVVIATGIYTWPASAATIDVPVTLFRLELPPRG